MNADLESRLRALPEHLDGLRASDDLAGAVRSRHRTHRRRRLLVASSAAAVLILLAGGAVAVGALRTDAAPAATAPATSTALATSTAPATPRLLPWPTRGPLAGDDTAVRTALQAAARHATGTNPPRLLWIGSAPPGLGRVLRVAVSQQDGTASRPGITLQWLTATTGNHWQLLGETSAELTTAATSLVMTGVQHCGGSSCTHTVGVLVIGAPDVVSVRYRLTPGPARQVAATGGIALTVETLPVDPDRITQVNASVAVTRSGGGSGDAAPGVPALLNPTVLDRPAAVEWQPARGLPQLLDAPETFPGLDLWGRLHGLSGRPPYGNPVWGGTLADGSRAVVAQPGEGGTGPYHLVFGVTAPDGTTVLVRDLTNPANVTTVRQVSALLPLSDGRCELVVVGEPGTTGVRYAGSAIAVKDGVGTLVLPSCDGHDADRITVTEGGTTTYAGPIDSTKPGGGVKRG